MQWLFGGTLCVHWLKVRGPYLGDYGKVNRTNFASLYTEGSREMLYMQRGSYLQYLFTHPALAIAYTMSYLPFYTPANLTTVEPLYSGVSQHSILLLRMFGMI